MSQAGSYVFTGGVGPIDEITGNTGSVVIPVAGNVNIIGAGNITTNGSGNTLTATLVGTTNHSIQLGNSSGSLTSLGVATNGQIPIGSTGANPVLSTITAGTGISVANGAGTITLAVTGTGVLQTLTGNTGGAISPTGGNINTVGSGNISIAGSGSTLTTTLVGTTNHSIQLGNSSGSLTSLGVATNGQIPIGSTGVDPVLTTLTAGTNISITNGAGSITIAANTTSQVSGYTGVNNAASPYTALSTDYYLGVDSTAGTVSILLPNAPATGRIFSVKDSFGQSATNNITITTVGGVVTIDGATTFVMNTTYESASFIFNGVSYEVY